MTKEDLSKKYGDGSGESNNEQMQSNLPDPFGEQEDDLAIGHLSIGAAPISISREETSMKLYLDSDQLEETNQNITMGSYVRIPFEDGSERMLLGIVEELTYQSPNSEVNPLGNHNESRSSYLAEIEPISIVSLDESNDFKSKLVSEPPQPSSRAWLVDKKDFLQTGLDIPQDGYYIGDIAVNGVKVPDPDNPLKYNLSNSGEPAIFRHMLMAGSTGQGKTHSTKNILRQFAELKTYDVEIESEDGGTEEVPRELNMVVFDPENEYIQMRDDNPELTDEQKKELRERDINYGGLKNDPDIDFEVFAPMADGIDASIEGMNISIPFSIVKGRPELLINADPKAATRIEIQEIVNQFFIEFPNKSEQTFENFKHWVEGTYFPRNDLNDALESGIKRRILTPSEYDRVFDSGGKPITEVVNEMFDTGQITIIPTGHLQGQKEKLIVLSILTHIVENKIGSNVEYDRIKNTPMLLCLDEAHEYLNEPNTARDAYIVENFRQTAKRGRKDLLGMYLITQSPQDIDDEVREQINTRIYLGLDEMVINNSSVFVPQEYERQIPQFNQGQMVVKQPNVKPVELKGLPYCLTKHE